MILDQAHILYPERLLICRTDRLGDVLLALPCMQLVKKLFPECRVDFLVQSYTAPIVRMVAGVDDVLDVSRDAASRSIRNLLKPHHYDTAVVLFPEFRLAKALRSAGIKVRAGIAYRWYSSWFTYRHREHRKDNLKHEAEYNLSLICAALSTKGQWEDILPPGEIFPLQMTIPEAVNLRLARILESVHRAGRKIVAIHPGGGGSAYRWPAASYVELARRLAAESDAILVVTGVEAELELCHEVSSAAEGSALNLCNQLSLEELTCLYSRCDLLLTNSTGPLHLARAIGRPVLGLFPNDPAMTPKRWGPYGLPESVMTPPNGKPMIDLNVEVVLQRIMTLLEDGV
jgi:ADP-heptose:LPS heptosyltransferase